jgi:type II secretory pathway pseudopilin PulG
VIRRVTTSVHAGFTLIEMIVATAMTMAVMGAILALVTSAQGAFQAQGEAVDMQQRLRASIDMLTMDVRSAGAIDAPVRPFRIGDVRDDGEAGVYYRPDTISVFYVPASGSSLPTPVLATRTYYLKANPADLADPSVGAFDLMQYDGRQTDLPVVDHVAGLAFEYFGDAGMIDPATLTDGPWRHDPSGRTFDADLLRIRDVGVTLRIRSALGARLVPDMEIRFHVAPRNWLPGTSDSTSR